MDFRATTVLIFLGMLMAHPDYWYYVTVSKKKKDKELSIELSGYRTKSTS